MLSLFQASGQKSLADLSKKYSTILERRMASDRANYAKIKTGVSNVDELADIFQNLEAFK